MVSEEPARTDASASGSLGPETQRTLWVLRPDRQLQGPGAVSAGSAWDLAEVAGAARRPPRHALGAPDSPTPVLLPARSPSRALCLRSKTVTQGTVCGKSARTGLWGRRRVTSGATRRGADGIECASASAYEIGTSGSESHQGRDWFQTGY